MVDFLSVYVFALGKLCEEFVGDEPLKCSHDGSGLARWGRLYGGRTAATEGDIYDC
jgi:hypothetical protein